MYGGSSLYHPITRLPFRQVLSGSLMLPSSQLSACRNREDVLGSSVWEHASGLCRWEESGPYRSAGIAKRVGRWPQQMKMCRSISRAQAAAPAQPPQSFPRSLLVQEESPESFIWASRSCPTLGRADGSRAALGLSMCGAFSSPLLTLLLSDHLLAVVGQRRLSSEPRTSLQLPRP